MSMEPKDRVWIELEQPRDYAHAQQVCMKANRMMDRLGDAAGQIFFWDEDDEKYCWGGSMGHITLADRGHWFNLDYLGREE